MLEKLKIDGIECDGESNVSGTTCQTISLRRHFLIDVIIYLP